jgi:protein O-mannosyl-transferase
MILFTKQSKKSIRLSVFFISLILILLTTAIYWQVQGFDFVNYDDTEYVSENPHIQKGVSSDSILWALTTCYFSNWHPLTWMSYMLDFQLFGLWAGGFHFVNLLFHLVNALLLFFLFRKMTGQIWQSGFLAIVFALHPLHVESVAWVSERKDVLSAFFWILTIHAYLRYVGRPVWNTYVYVVIFFVMGLMSKPMVVTLPFVLLLLDFWPLRRFGLDAQENKLNLKISGLIREKIPLFLLTLVSAGITFYAQKHGGAVRSFDHLPLDKRLANITISYIDYITKFIYPNKLAIFYPYPDMIPWWKIISAIMTLALLTGLAIRFMHRSRYVIVGWLWFLGTLVPVIGLIQVGSQSMADRYMYLPMIGLSIIVAWGFPDLLAPIRRKRAVIGAMAVIIIPIASAITWRQIGYWQNSITLFSHAVKTMPDNILAHAKLGETLSKQGKFMQAIAHYKFVLKKKPTHHDALINMGLTLLNMKNPSEAIGFFNQVLEIKQDDSQALRLTGYAMAAQGNYEKAIPYYEIALSIEPSNSELYFLMGIAYNALANQTLAVKCYQKAIELKPDDTPASINLGNIYYRNGQMDLAGNIYRYALQHEPTNPDLLSKLGVVALGMGQIDRALKFFNQALSIRPDHPESQKGLEAIQKIKQK